MVIVVWLQKRQFSNHSRLRNYLKQLFARTEYLTYQMSIWDLFEISKGISRDLYGSTSDDCLSLFLGMPRRVFWFFWEYLSCLLESFLRAYRGVFETALGIPVWKAFKNQIYKHSYLKKRNNCCNLWMTSRMQEMRERKTRFLIITSNDRTIFHPK